jgi:PKD repeat protein
VLSGTAPYLTYTPHANANGTDSFTFCANDGRFDSPAATVTINITPVNDAPVARVTSNVTSGVRPLAVSFNGSTSSDVDGNPLTFRWAFGNGATASGSATASYTYSTAGTFTATLTVTDSAGATSSATRVITVSNPTLAEALPTPELNWPERVPVGSPLQVSYPESTPVKHFEWRFIRDDGRALQQDAVDAAPAIHASDRTLGLQDMPAEAGVYWVEVVAVGLQDERSAPARARVTLSASVSANIQVFPNPWEASEHQPRVTFRNVPATATIQIFTVAGHQVRSLPAGTSTWDLKTDSGDAAASGLYLYVVKDGSTLLARGRLAIVR